jgi:threonylcarbamoyladenosine tRNA methylthiotransferase MtaB
MKKFKIITLGCRTNQYESQGYADQLRELGYTPAREGEEADVCIVNTCTVTEGADSASRHEIRSVLRLNPTAKLVVTGCMAKRSSAMIHSIDPKISIVPNELKEQLVAQIFPHLSSFPEFAIQSFDGHTRAFVKVQDGCNSFCSYCIIPYVRGRSRSRSIAEVLREVKGLIANGYKEVVLTGINVGDFDGGGRLSDLVRAVDALDGLERLRISSIDPNEIDEELSSVILNGRTTCPSMHIVLQSGSNKILKQMNRKYTREQFLETVDRMCCAASDFTVTTDVIVGFPGETEGDFQETLDMVARVRCAKVHVFPFSSRPKTRAAHFPHPVPADEIYRRKQELLQRSDRSAFDLRQQFVGRRMSVLLESEEEKGSLYGYTSNFLRVGVPLSGAKPNELVDVELIENGPDGLKGKIL